MRERRFTVRVATERAVRDHLAQSPMVGEDACWCRFRLTRIPSGVKTRHPVGGTVNGIRVRAVVEVHDEVTGFLVGPAWLRGCGLAAGDPA